MDPLAQLKDIHLPQPISLWPPAAGWWVLALLSLLTAIGLVFLLLRQIKKNRYRREALRELKQIYQHYEQDKNKNLFSININILLKKVSVFCYGKKAVSRLNALDWLTFLDHAGRTLQFSQGAGQVLAFAPYAEQQQMGPRDEINTAIEAEINTKQLDAEALYQCSAQWIKKHK